MPIIDIDDGPYLVVEEEVNHFEVLVVDGHEQGRPPEGVAAVDVQHPFGLEGARKHPEMTTSGSYDCSVIIWQLSYQLVFPDIFLGVFGVWSIWTLVCI